VISSYGSYNLAIISDLQGSKFLFSCRLCWSSLQQNCGYHAACVRSELCCEGCELGGLVGWCVCVSGVSCVVKVVSWVVWSAGVCVSGAVGGQPDVLSSVDVTTQQQQQHTAAQVQYHSSDADSPSLLQQQSTESPLRTVRTVATVESADRSPAADRDVASVHTTTTAVVDTSSPHQTVDPSLIPVR